MSKKNREFNNDENITIEDSFNTNDNVIAQEEKELPKQVKINGILRDIVEINEKEFAVEIEIVNSRGRKEKRKQWYHIDILNKE